jgi:tetratricopeptide (TPR) repeat protein
MHTTNGFSVASAAAVAALLIGCALASSPAVAQDLAPSTAAMNDTTVADLPPCAPRDAAQESRDREVLKAANEAGAHGGVPAAMKQVKALEEALGHAPAKLNGLETCDGVVYLRTGAMTDFLVISAKFTKAPGVKSVQWVPTPYPDISLLLGSLYNEKQQWDLAIAALRRGLALEPHDPLLASETAHALNMAGRFEESLAVSDQGLAGSILMKDEDRARLLRMRGFALGELRRYEEAEQAYRDSLDLAPNNPTALNELKYLAQQRKGAPPAPTISVNSRTGKPTGN